MSSCFTLAVKVHYTNKMFLIFWQNYLSSLAKSKGFNKEIKLQEIGKVRKLLQECSLLDDSLGTGVGWWSFPDEWIALTESWDYGRVLSSFWCDIREEIFFYCYTTSSTHFKLNLAVENLEVFFLFSKQMIFVTKDVFIHFLGRKKVLFLWTNGSGDRVMHSMELTEKC